MADLEKLLNQRRKAIYDRLTTKHEMDRDTSLAILANLEHESGNLDPAMKQRGSTYKDEKQWWTKVDSTKYGRGTGLAQWDGDRRFKLKEYAEKNKSDVYDLNTQVDFVVHELNTSENAALKDMMSKTTLEEKAESFARKYERAGIPHMDKRLSKLKSYAELGIDSTVLTPEQQASYVIQRPLPDEMQEDIVKDAQALKVSMIPEAPNSIQDSRAIIDQISSKLHANLRNDPKAVYDSVNDFVKQKTSNDFGGATSYQQSGLFERGARATAGFIAEAPSYIAENVKKIPNIEQADIDEAMDHFTNQLTEESAVGNVVQRGITAAMTSGEIDVNFDPKKDMLYEHLTKDLDGEDLKNLLENYSFNQKDFHTVGHLMNARNKRIKEMEEFAKENPVLNAAGFMGALMTDAAIMMPVTSAIAAQGAATFSRASFKSLDAAKKLGWLTAAETLEQGAQELVWSAYKKDYEFSMPIFMAGIGTGVGLRGVIDSVQNNKMMRDIIANEDGFIRLSSDKAKALVKQVAKETDNKQAQALARRLSEVKLHKAQEIRTRLVRDFDIIQSGIQEAKAVLKSVAKGTPEYKAAKGELQKLIRRSKSKEKNTVLEMRQLLDGSHPQLSSALNPQFKIKQMAKELDIDYSLVNSPEKIREFLGLKSGQFAEGVVVDGEKGYELILNRQLKELDGNKRINVNHFLTKASDLMETSPLDINAGLGRYLHKTLKDTASTDSAATKYLFNKGNLVNSENQYVRGLYNWLAPDNSGRQGMSKIRAGETKTIYRNRFHGQLMDNYKTQGYRLLKHMYKDQGAKKYIKLLGDFTSFEREVVPVFKDRLQLDPAMFKSKYADVEIQKIADDFAKEYNKLNKEVADLAVEKGVIGAGANSENYIHRAWASNKARLVPKEDLEAALVEGMRKSLLDAGLPIEESFLKEQARNFAFGLQSKDITNNIEATSNYIDNLNKFLKSSEGQSSKEVTEAVESAIEKANAQKVANELKELGKRADIDITVEIPNTNGKTLGDLLEDNFISTQDRYNSRMAARIAAAEHGIKDINALDAWKADALLQEKKRLIANNSEHINEGVNYLDKVLSQDIKSFKYGGLGGQGDVIEAEANDYIRLAKKITVTNLMQNTGIASMAEFGGTIAEVGMFNAVKSTIDPIKHMLRRNHLLRDSVSNVRSITDDMAALTGIGFEDMAFTSRGVSQAEQIFKDGALGKFETAVDALGSVTQGTLGWVEQVGRRATANSLAIKWGRHFQGQEPDGIIKQFMAFDTKTTNRTLENAGLGTYVQEGSKKVFKTNKTYDSIKENYMKHVSFDDKGNVKRMNFEKWQPEARDAFRDTIKLQTSHIYVDPDSTTAAFWQTTSLGRILNQFRTFSVNATSKVAGFTYGNLVNGIKHNDMHEVLKFGNKMFWATTMGTMAVGLRDELTTMGTGDDSKGFAAMADTPLQSLAIGFSRSSLIGNMDVINGVGGSLFGYDNIFNRSSFTGRDRNFFNLANTPIGQVGVNTFRGTSSLLQGDLEGAGTAVGNLTPFKRQLGIQQMINYMNK
jgi:hypothetical protein